MRRRVPTRTVRDSGAMSTPDPADVPAADPAVGAADPTAAAVPSAAPADRGSAPIPTPGVGDSVTGVPSVDLALGRLDGLVGATTNDHAAVYEQVHADLRSALEDPEDPGQDPARSTLGQSPGPALEPGATAAS